MNLSAMGPLHVVVAQNRTDQSPNLRKDGVDLVKTAELEGSGTGDAPGGGALADIIELAKKKAQARKNKAALRRRSLALACYHRIENFEELRSEKGQQMDREV